VSVPPDDPLVDLRTVLPLRVAGRPTADSAVRLRSGVVDRLVAAQSLLPRHARLLIVRGYAPDGAAGHDTGAAVDLSLSTVDGEERPLESTAAADRALLSKVLAAMGLVNHPTRWWHWSYGDRYWAVVTGAAATRYRPVCVAPTGGPGALGSEPLGD
jgi:zinc D-Ala-D-Ala dipeptidase